MDSSPVELKPFIDAFTLQQERKDDELWTLGIYVYSAVSTAIEHNFMGRKAKSKYLEKPLLREAMEKKKMEDKMQNLTDEEKLKYTKLLFAQLETMKNNFELGKKN